MTDNSSLAVPEYDVTGATAGSEKTFNSSTRIEQDKPSHESGPTESDAENVNLMILSAPAQNKTTKVEVDVSGHGSQTPGKRVARQHTVGSSTTLYQSLDYLAVSTGRHVVDLPYGSLDVVSKLLTMQQYPEVSYSERSAASLCRRFLIFLHFGKLCIFRTFILTLICQRKCCENYFLLTKGLVRNDKEMALILFKI